MVGVLDTVEDAVLEAVDEAVLEAVVDMVVLCVVTREHSPAEFPLRVSTTSS